MKKLVVYMLLASYLFGLNLMTEDYPPYNYKNDKGQIEGIATDIVREIIKQTGDKDNIKVLPWARSYMYIQKKKNQVLFSMTRTEQREKLFKWVGPIASNNWVFFAKKGSNIKINSLDEVKNSKYKIGTYKNDACELFLKEKGFKNIASVPKDDLNVKKLIKQRINLWIVGEYQGLVKAAKFGKIDQIEKVFDVKATQLYIAFSKDVSDDTINRWQKELDNLKANGKYQKILDKYLK
jgi:polar amino acid transport system substrate-binding protein